MCSRLQEYRIKLILLNQVLIMKDQDSEHIQEHLKKVGS